MIIDVFKDKTFFDNLTIYNQVIRQVCRNYRYARPGREYDLANRVVSYWFDPKYQKELHISHFYPEMHPIQKDPKFNLILYFPNYVSIYIINKIYNEIPNILIEDEACGMSRFAFYLSKMGFSNFIFTENFTQCCESMLHDLMEKTDIRYTLNQAEAETFPTVINLVGWPALTRNTIPDNTELICLYNQNTLINKKVDPPQLKNNAGVYITLEDFRLLCYDVDQLLYTYCKKDRYQDFSNRLQEVKAI